MMAEHYINDNNDKIWLEWIGKADQDLLSLESLLRHKEGSPSTGCFLAQQAIEKLLKSILVFHKIELEKIHDLVVLHNKVKTHEPETEQFLKDVLTITRYYIETRYPGDFQEFTWEECQKAYEVARDLRKFVVNKLI